MNIFNFLKKSLGIGLSLSFFISLSQAQDASVFELEKSISSESKSSDSLEQRTTEITLEKDSDDVLFVQEEEKPQYTESNSLKMARFVQTRKYIEIENLLQNGVDINSDLMLGNTMLHLGAMHNDLKMVDLALKYGAKIDKLNKSAESAIHWACARGNLKILNAILSYSENTQDDLNRKSKRGRACLHFSVMYNDSQEMLRFLILNKSDISIRDENLQTPLHYAAVFQKISPLMILLSHNANILAIDKNNETVENYILEKFNDSDLLKVLDYLSPKNQKTLIEKVQHNADIWKDVEILE